MVVVVIIAQNCRKCKNHGPFFTRLISIDQINFTGFRPIKYYIELNLSTFLIYNIFRNKIQENNAQLLNIKKY